MHTMTGRGAQRRAAWPRRLPRGCPGGAAVEAPWALLCLPL